MRPTRALPLTRFRCGGGLAFNLTMRYCRSPHSPAGCSLACWIYAAALGLGQRPKPRQGASPLRPTRALPLTRFRCGGGLAFNLIMRYCRSPHSPAGCSLAYWTYAAALGLGRCPKPRQGASPLRPTLALPLTRFRCGGGDITNTPAAVCAAGVFHS